MIKTHLNKIVFTAGISLLLPFTATQAREGFEVGAGISNVEFNRASLNEHAGPRVHAGYRFGNPWSVELNGTYIEPRVNTLGYNINFEQVYLNTLYHFNADKSVEPYISFGYGANNLHSDTAERSSTSGAVGFGLKYYPSNGNFFIRPEVQVTRAAEFRGENYVTSLTLGYIFDSGSPAPVVAKPKPVVVAAPKPVAPIDSDGDGVVDTSDACPSTPAGVSVDSRGCELKVDSDGDGVLDGKDKCPDTAKRLKVTPDGCPIKLKKAVSIDIKVNFASNSDVVLAQYFGEIRKVADFMAQYEGTVVEIEGHTDTRGAADYNKSLSQRRADSVAKILVQQMGVASSRVKAKGYGEERPIADESTKSGLLANRRVVGTVSTEVESLQEN